MVYIPPPPTNTFFVEANYFFVSSSWDPGKFQSSWGTSALGVPNFLFGREDARPFSFIKASMSNHVNQRIVDGKMHVCMLTFLTFTCEYSL